MENFRFWNALRTPPASALKTIEAGRLRGKTDINPQWRMQAMTDVFGPCGVGWYYEIVRLWNDPLPSGEVIAHALVNLYVKVDGEWSKPIPGVGGNMLVERERAGLHVSDEGYKMAVTDALSVAMKALGVAADVYLGQMETKYSHESLSEGLQEPSAPAGHTNVPPETSVASEGHSRASERTLQEYIETLRNARNADVMIRLGARKAEELGARELPLWELFLKERGYVTHWLIAQTRGFAHDKACEFYESLPEWVRAWTNEQIAMEPAAVPEVMEVADDDDIPF